MKHLYKKIFLIQLTALSLLASDVDGHISGSGSRHSSPGLNTTHQSMNFLCIQQAPSGSFTDQLKHHFKEEAIHYLVAGSFAVAGVLARIAYDKYTKSEQDTFIKTLTDIAQENQLIEATLSQLKKIQQLKALLNQDKSVEKDKETQEAIERRLALLIANEKKLIAILAH